MLLNKLVTDLSKEIWHARRKSLQSAQWRKLPL